MATSFTLELDTTPPVISLGPVPVAAPEELLEVPFTVNEPGVTEATLGGRNFAVLPGKLRGRAPAGPRAELVIQLRDEVWNTDEARFMIPIRDTDPGAAVGQTGRADTGGVTGRTSTGRSGRAQGSTQGRAS